MVGMSKHRARYQLPITIGWIAAIIFGIKVLWFASGDMTTAVEVVRHLDFLPTVTAMAMTLVPVLIVPVVAYFTIRMRESFEGDDDDSRIIKAVWSLLLTLSIVFSGILPAAAAVFWWVAHLIYKLAKKRGWSRKFEILRFELENVQPIVSLFVVVALLSGSPWLAKQEVTIEGEPYLIYLLSEESGVVTFVEEDPRTVVRTQAERIEQRRLCESGFSIFTTPILALVGEETYSSCAHGTASSDGALGPDNARRLDSFEAIPPPLIRAE